MYIFLHAWKNIWRNKGRNLLITAILFAIISTTVVTLIISSTSTTMIDDYEETFSSQVVINPDIEKLREEASANSTTDQAGPLRIQRPELEPELLLSFTESDFLKESLVAASLRANSSTITAIDASNETTNTQPMKQSGFANGDFTLLGDDYTAFTEGNRLLLDDEVSVYPENANEALISTDLATANGLAVGDSITLTSQLTRSLPETIDQSTLTAGEELTLDALTYTVVLDERSQTFTAQRTATYDLTIVGLYEDLRSEYADTNLPESAAFNNRNEIITPLSTLLTLRQPNESGLTLEIEYYLQNPADLAAFEAEVREKGLPETFSVTTDTAAYEQLVGPLNGIRNIALTFLMIVLILGAIIIFLLTSISIRERKYEIGVLRAMGMKKSLLATSFWLELVFITLACVILGSAFGASIAQPISNSLLASQTQQSQQQENGRPGMDQSMGQMPSPGMIQGGKNPQQQSITLQTQLTAFTFIQILGIALVLSSLGGLIAIRQITRFEPMKILSERN